MESGSKVLGICQLEEVTYLLNSDGEIQVIRTPNVEKSSTQEHEYKKKKFNAKSSRKFYQLKFLGEFVQIVQMVQGRSHILFLSISGEVYGVGNNDKYQLTKDPIIPKNKELVQNKTVKANFKELLGRKDKNNKELEAGQNKVINYLTPVKIEFKDKNELIYKLYAFNDTSMAYSRSGSIFMWGVNSINDEYQMYNPLTEEGRTTHPSEIMEILGIEISQNSKVYFLMSPKMALFKHLELFQACLARF